MTQLINHRSIIKLLKLALSLLLVILVGCNTKPTEEPDKSAKPVKDEFALLNDEIAANPDNAELYFKRSKFFMQKRNVKQAFTDISKAVSLDSSRADYFLQLADVSFSGLRIPVAIDAFNKAISLEPANLTAHLKLAELYLYLKTYPQCIYEANEALKIDKNAAKAYFIKGFAFKEQGDTSKAISSFITATEVQSDYYDAYIQLGNIEAARKRKIAMQYYNNALRLQPGSTEALYNRGLLLQNMGELDKAIEDYKTILKIDRGYADAHYNLGYIDLAYKKEYKKAIDHFTNAIRLNENYVEAFYNRGVCFEVLGDKKSAEKDYRHCLSIVPDYKLAKNKLKN